MSNVSQWSTTAASNSSASPDGWPENMSPAGVNDSARENMAAVAKWFGDTKGGLVTTGTGSAYVLSTNNSNAALADISLLAFRVHTANTGSATLAVDGLTAKALKLNGQSLSADDLPQDTIVLACYNANNDEFDIIKSSSATEPSLTRSARTSNTILAEADNNTLIDFTANTFTQTLTAAATLGDGWSFKYKNSGTGIVTLDPNGSETIDGDATLTVLPGDEGEILCDGSNFYRVSKGNINQVTETVLGEGTVSAQSSIDITWSETGFDEVQIELINWIPSVDGRNLYGYTTTDGGSNWDGSSGNYNEGSYYLNDSGAVTGARATTATQMTVVAGGLTGNAANENGVTGTLRIYRPEEAEYTRLEFIGSVVSPTGVALPVHYDGQRLSAADVNGFRGAFNTGNISGSYKVVGIKRG